TELGRGALTGSRLAPLFVHPAPSLRIDAAIGFGVVHHVALDGIVAFLVLEGHFLLVDAARRLANPRIALEVEIVGVAGLGLIGGHDRSFPALAGSILPGRRRLRRGRSRLAT